MLVGGEGTRLRPLTLTTPKPLLPVANQVFLDRQLSWLAAHGVDEVALSLGYLPDAFQARFPDGRFVDDAGRVVHLVYAVEPVPLGTAGAVRFAAGHLDVDERIVVCNGDVLTGLDLGALVAFHDDRDAEATIHLAQVGDPSAFGVVPTFGDGEVKAFVEKPPPGCAPTDWINAGTYVLEPSIFERIPAGLCVSIERETFPRLLEQRGRLFAMAERRLLDRHRHRRPVPPGPRRPARRPARVRPGPRRPGGRPGDLDPGHPTPRRAAPPRPARRARHRRARRPGGGLGARRGRCGSRPARS